MPWVLVLWWLRRGVLMHALAAVGLVAGTLVSPLVGLTDPESARDAPLEMLRWAWRTIPWVLLTWTTFGLLAIPCHVLTREHPLGVGLATGSSGAVVAVLVTRFLDPAWAPSPLATLAVISVVALGFGGWSIFDAATLAARSEPPGVLAGHPRRW